MKCTRQGAIGVVHKNNGVLFTKGNPALYTGEVFLYL